MLCCFYCFLVHNRNLRCSFLFVILNRFVFDIFNIFSSDKVIFPVPSHSCHLMPVYLLTDWIFSRRSLLESSTATEQPLHHRRPALGFTSANLVRNKGFSSAPPPARWMCVWECDEVLLSARKMMHVKCKNEPPGLSLWLRDKFRITWKRWVTVFHVSLWLRVADRSCLCDTRYEEVHGGILASLFRVLEMLGWYEV